MFEEYKRPTEMPIQDYMIKFDSLHGKIKSLGMELPEGVKAYRLLHSANISDDEVKLCLATMAEFNYSEMRSQIMKICADEIATSSGTATTTIKEEPVFQSTGFKKNYSHQDERKKFSNRGGYQSYRGKRGGGTRNRGRDSTSDKGMNPPKPNGEISRCVICDSKYHWAKSCPEKHRANNFVGMCENDDFYTDEESCEINLFQSSVAENDLEGLVGETLGCAVLDSGCNKVVTGEVWFNCYKDTLEENERSKLTTIPSQQIFKFGEGKSFPSLGKVRLPATIGSKKVTIETEIVTANIPLLLSKELMKKTKTVLDFNNDNVEMLGEVQKLIETSSGHYAIPITITKHDHKGSIKHQVALISKSPKASDSNDIKKIAEKLHRQFCHCSAEKLIRLVKTSGLWKNDKELIKEIEEITKTCQICKRFKKSPPVPIVSLPLSSAFNECVAMDLVMIDGQYILHLIDTFTRFSVACVRRTKTQDTITDAIMKTWISYFGKPAKFIADNGGEFSNATYTDMCDALGIEMLKTAAMSPWSNGLCERHNGILKESVMKTMEDTGCSIENAVAWSVWTQWIHTKYPSFW